MKITYTKTSNPPISKLIHKKTNRKSKLVYIDTENSQDDVDRIEAPNGYKFQPLPYVLHNQRQSVFVSGPSGVGKSVWSANYVKELRKITSKDKKHLPIYLFTAQRVEDKAYENITNFHKVNIYDPKLFQLKVEELQNSITIWDDWDQAPKQINKFLHDLLRRVLELGRKLNIHVITLTHESLGGNFTKPIILESQAFVVFPRLSYRTSSQFLKNYMGFDKNELQELKKLDTRSVYVNKQFPQYIVSDYEIRLL